MTFQNPAAAWALVALAVPVLIHMLVRRRSRATPFPTLRFIPETRLASIERRTLEDGALLLIRLGVFGAAAAAVAGPFLITASRQRAWDRDVVRAEIAAGVPARGDAERTFTTASLTDGIGEAMAWLDRQRPGRRELIVRSPFPIGSMTAADVEKIPPHLGLRFERLGELPATRSIAGTPVVDVRAGGGIARRSRQISLDGARTSVRDLAASDERQLPIEIATPPSRRTSADDVVKMVLARRVPAPIDGRTARIELVEDGEPQAGAVVGDAIRTPWMAEATDRIWRDMSAQTAVLKGARFSASGDRLVVGVRSTISDADLVRLTSSVLNALGGPPDQPHLEITPIADAQLSAWSRPAGPARMPAPDQRPWDGRWLWLTALMLLAIESLVRGSLRRRADSSTVVTSERTRVA